MAITSGFFDSVDGDRTYNAEQMSNYFDGLVSDGVYESIGDRFLVSKANDGMKTNVGSGRAIIRSHWVKNDATVTLTHDPSDVQKHRIDAVVLRLDNTARSITLTLKKGTPFSDDEQYVIPPITRNSNVYELYLAAVLIPSGSTEPSQIMDLRPSSYCGWVTGVVKQVNTSDLFNQWNDAYASMFADFETYMAETKAQFNEWFSTLTEQLTVECGFIKLESYTIIEIGEPILILPIRIDEYDPSTDALMVYFAGKFMMEGQDYVQEDHPRFGHCIRYIGPIVLAHEEIRVNFVVFKNIIGKNVLTAGAAKPQTTGTNQFAAGIAEFTEV